MGLPPAIGPYVVVRELGRGGMGVVYEVRHPRLPRRLALKVLLEPDERSRAHERFAREATALARVKHRSVVGVIDFARAPQGPYLVTELVEGTSLRDLALPLEPRRAAEVVRALADALHAVHAAGVLHRDLKPENAMLQPDGTPVLLDFGLAREHDARSLTEEGALLGTPAYMAPEQLGDGKSVDARVDVYGLGAVLLFLLTGAPPFAGQHLEVLTKVLRDEPRWPAGAPPGLLAVLRRAMAKERDVRLPSAAALRDDLARWLADGGSRPPARSPGPARAVVALSVGALVAVGLAVAARSRGTSAPAPGTEVAPTTEAAPATGPAPAPEAAVASRARPHALPLAWERHEGGPSGRDNLQGALAWDRGRGRVWLYGGYERGTTTALADLWSWDGVAWTAEEVPEGPGPRYGHSVVHDAGRDVLVVFGGKVDSKHTSADDRVWELDLGAHTWRSHPSPAELGRRAWAGMAYCDAWKATLLFGGLVGRNDCPGDLWSWDGEAWRLLAGFVKGSSPQGRLHVACAYHAGAFYVHGGRSEEGRHARPLWRWTGAAWEQLTEARDETGPPPREGHVLVHDGERLLLYGGRQGKQPDPQVLFDDLWAYEGTAWRQLLDRGPGARVFHGAAFDPVRRRLVVFGGSEWHWGGRNLSLPPDTWTFPVDASGR